MPIDASQVQWDQPGPKLDPSQIQWDEPPQERPDQGTTSIGRQFLESGKQALSGILEGAMGAVNLPMEAVRAGGEVLGVPRSYLPLSTEELYQRNIESGITAEPSSETGGKAVRFASGFLGAAAATPAKTVNVVEEGMRKALPALNGAGKTAPDLEKLRGLADAAYAKAENAGVVVSKNSLRRTVRSIKEHSLYEGLDKTLHPKATAVIKRLEESSGKELSFKELETLRRVAKGAASSIEPDERRIAGIIVDKIDDFMTNMKPSDVVSRDPKAAKVASDSLQSARLLWSRFKKGETVEELVERAKNRAGQFSGSGYENALRTEFRQLAQNKKRMRVFSPEEQRAIRVVARGGTMENGLRFLGKFAPTGTISTLIGGGAGYAVGGPVGSAVLLGAGAAARTGATLLTERNARRASEIMRGGEIVSHKSPGLIDKAISIPATQQGVSGFSLQLYQQQATDIRERMEQVKQSELSNRQKREQLNALKSEMGDVFKEAGKNLDRQEFRELRTSVK